MIIPSAQRLEAGGVGMNTINVYEIAGKLTKLEMPIGARILAAVPVRFGSVCSGIEAASVAWHPLGWQAAWLSEIAPFPCAVLAHHYPSVPNHGDMATLPARITAGEVEAPDVFTGGTPCQAFSVAGKRGSLDDARGNLSLTFCEIANAIDDVRHADGREPSIIVWENVPGVFSTADNAFGCFLGALAGSGCELQPAGGRWTNAGVVLGPRRAIAWRILDAQYFGLAQHRRRVFVVASARNGVDPAAILFEFEGLRRDSAPSRKTGEGVTGSLTASAGGSDENDAANGRIVASTWPADIACTLNAAFGEKMGLEDQHALAGASLFVMGPIAYTTKLHNTTSNNAGKLFEERTTCLDGSSPPPALLTATQVRRLTVVECEKLQGFLPGYTAIPWRKKPAADCPDGPRYQAIGNSWAVPVAAWIGARIAAAVRT